MNNEVWYIIPSVNLPMAAKTLPEWRRHGYKIGILTSPSNLSFYLQHADCVICTEAYLGYPWAVRQLATHAAVANSELIVTGGDDIFPDPNLHASQIAKVFANRFPDGFGIMQPIGDGRGCDEICGSPWIGRKLMRRLYFGLGPFWPGYNHYYNDRELCLVAEQLGLLWRCETLTQRHEHWSWTTKIRPPHMQKHHRRYHLDRLLFEYRKSRGFPGHIGPSTA